jgi:glycine betaine/proline transport system substrate-binding protein
VAGNVRPIANTYLGGPMEGWFIPHFLSEAHPELKRASDLLSYRETFAPTGRGRFISCPPDWACAVINRNLLRALHLNFMFEIVEPENRFELDQLIADAISRRQPVLFYYWTPNGTLSQFGFESLDMGLFVPDAFPCLATPGCTQPQASSFPGEPVVTAIAGWVSEEAPRVADYFQHATMPIEEMNRLLEFQNRQDADAAVAARSFVSTRGEIWREWVSD